MIKPKIAPIKTPKTKPINDPEITNPKPGRTTFVPLIAIARVIPPHKPKTMTEIATISALINNGRQNAGFAVLNNRTSFNLIAR